MKFIKLAISALLVWAAVVFWRYCNPFDKPIEMRKVK